MIKELYQCAEKNNLTISNYILKEFVNNPAEFEKKYTNLLIKQLMDKGLYFMNLGLEKIDDAIQMFQNLLQIQPDNVLAKEYLEKLNNEKKKIQQKKPPEIQPKKTEPVKKTGEKKKTNLLPVGIGSALVVLGIIGFIIFKLTGKEEEPHAVVPEKPPQVAVAPPPAPAPPVPDVKPPEQVEEKTDAKEEKPAIVDAPKVEKKAVEKTVVREKKPLKVEKKKEPKAEEPKKIVAVKIEPEEPPPPPKPPEITQPTEKIEYSYIMIKVNPWADVYVDGKHV